MYDYRLIFRKVIIPSLQNEMLPFPIDRKICTGWANGIKRRGETILYTGCMYQIAYLSSKLAEILEKIPENLIYGLLGFTSVLRLYKPPADELERAYRILNNIARILRKNHVDFGYLYDEEPYSGALLLEAGFFDEFSEYAKKVTDKFKEKGVKRIITVDPHSLNALSKYSEFAPNFDIEVVNYLDLIMDIGEKIKLDLEFTIHDSCLYSKFLNRREKYRELLRQKGLRITEDWMITSPENSLCCGAPIEVINPSLSKQIAEIRVKQLKKLSNNILVVCPFCYANLSKANDPQVKIKDLAEFL